MSFLKRLFGGSGDAGGSAVQAEEHAGFMIYVMPKKEAAGYRIAARIEKVVGDETTVHHMIRADVVTSEEEARSTTLLKAKALIDQQGDGIF